MPDGFAQLASQTTVVASANSVVYGGSVLLDISAISLSPSYLNLTTAPLYTAYIYGGELDASITIILYPQYGKAHAFFLASRAVIWHDERLLDTPMVVRSFALIIMTETHRREDHACDVHESLCVPMPACCSKLCTHLSSKETVHALYDAHNATLTRVTHACADVNGDIAATGTYELNTTDLSGCAGGTFVISAVFSDIIEWFGDSTGTATLVVQPTCPPVRPCMLRFFQTASMQVPYHAA
jgi:hypothetical protein